MNTAENLTAPGEFQPQGEFLGKWLNGSQRKTAFALRSNAETMVREDGLNCTGFLTLTVGDYNCGWHGKQIPANGGKASCPVCGVRMQFRQVHDAAEASRRINNLNRRVLADLFERAIIVTERHKTRAIHFHLLGTLRGRPDIRTGLKFERVYRRDYRSASPALRDLWAMLRDVLPRYGFGRAELLPVRKTGDAVAAYVAKYIEKNVCARGPEDKGKKLVRYIGWEKRQLKANDFEWNGPRAIAWRAKAAELVGLVGAKLADKPDVQPAAAFERMLPDLRKRIRPKALDGTDAAEAFGPRWAWVVTRFIASVNDSLTPFVIWDGWAQKQAVRGELLAEVVRNSGGTADPMRRAMGVAPCFGMKREENAECDARFRAEILTDLREEIDRPDYWQKKSPGLRPAMVEKSAAQ